MLGSIDAPAGLFVERKGEETCMADNKGRSTARRQSGSAKAKPRLEVPQMPAKPAYAMAPSVRERGGANRGKAPAAEVEGGKGSGAPDRRNWMATGFWSLAAVTLLWTLATVRFFFPRVLREPPSKFKVGFPEEFTAEKVQTRFKAQYGIWITNTIYNGQQQLVALKSVCTHLGCTPSWLESEQKFKCHCHGSGFYKDGINFEGPAPRPLERYAIRIADDGQIEIDKSRTFQQEMGEWEDPACYISV